MGSTLADCGVGKEMDGFGASKFMLGLMILSVLCCSAMSKECTNVPSQTASHTFRYALLSSNNETWKHEVLTHYHLTPTDDSVWSTLLPRKMLREEDELNWSMMYRKMKVPFQSSGDFLKEVSLHDVRLDPTSFHWQAQQTNLEYLLMLDVDRLVWSFRKTAGLATPGVAYGGWEDPTVELRGHFVGHYLSASAQMWASTHNDTLNERMSAVVSALSECQEKMGTGYLSAFPSEFFDRFEAVKPVWAPYYTIHKIMAGLLDQYTFAGNDQALKMTASMADYFFNRVQNVISKYTVERHYRSLNEETGGMNDVLYRLFSITKDSRHVLLAHLFDKPCFLGLLAVQADDISDFHANTHIPVVVGSQMRYEITGDTLYRDVGEFFMDIVNSSHSYATGGTSVSEFWSDPKRLATTLESENEESCTTYNMLKVSRNLFRWTREVAYADYYERAFTNGVLGIQRGTEPGVMIYMLPLSAGGSKAKSYHSWGTPFNSFWCCYGTGVESFSKLGDSIYFEGGGQEPSLYVIQFIPSSLIWRSGEITINQKVDPVTSFDPYVRVTFSVSSEGTGKSSTLNLRVPIWTNLDGAKASINGESLPLTSPGTFLSINRKWSNGDVVSLELPIYLRKEAIKDDRSEYASLQAILYGPYLLAGHSAGESQMKSGSSSSLSDWITPVDPSDNDHLVTFSQASGDTDLVLTNMDRSITLQQEPSAGTEGAVHATFKLVSSGSTIAGSSRSQKTSGQVVMLESYDLPGMFMAHNGTDTGIIVSASASADGSSTFRLVQGLDGKNGSVSIESVNFEGCYIFSDLKVDGTVKLNCGSDNSSSSFSQGASFVMFKGLSEYHPISFIAEGEKQNFLLAPLMSFRDETYNVYFNFQ